MCSCADGSGLSEGVICARFLTGCWRLFVGSLGTVLSAGAAEDAKLCDPGEFNLDDLPIYKPEWEVAGTVRNFGFGLSGVLKLCEEDFRKIQPGSPEDSSAAIAAEIGSRRSVDCVRWRTDPVTFLVK